MGQREKYQLTLLKIGKIIWKLDRDNVEAMEVSRCSDLSPEEETLTSNTVGRALAFQAPIRKELNYKTFCSFCIPCVKDNQ